MRGCGRGDRACDDPGKLYDSVVGTLFALPDDTLVYPTHHLGGVAVTTIGAERLYNPDLAARDRGAFLAKCRTRSGTQRAARRADCSAATRPADASSTSSAQPAAVERCTA